MHCSAPMQFLCEVSKGRGKVKDERDSKNSRFLGFDFTKIVSQ